MDKPKKKPHATHFVWKTGQYDLLLVSESEFAQSHCTGTLIYSDGDGKLRHEWLYGDTPEVIRNQAFVKACERRGEIPQIVGG